MSTDAASAALDEVVALVRHLGDAISAEGATALDVGRSLDGELRDDGSPLAVKVTSAVTGVRSVSITRRWDSEAPNAADVLLSTPLPLAELEERLGQAASVPSAKPGARQVRLGDPAGGAPWTVFAHLDGADGDAASKLTVRRDG